MNLAHAAVVATGGAVGALARWGVGLMVLRLGATTLVGTLAVNLIGCLIIGFAKAMVDLAGWGSDEARLFLFTGLLGAFTTFSTFEADVFQLWRDDARALAVAYVAVSVGGGFLLFLIGWSAAQRVLS